jgi:hypothetical protein
MANNGTLDPNRLPSNFGDVLWASFGRATKDVIRKTGMSRIDIRRRLPAMINGLKNNTDGSLSLNSFYTSSERQIMSVLAGSLVAQPAFNAARLFTDFSATLRSHGLLQQSEIREFANLQSAIGLFTAAIMHNSSIRLADGTSITLTIGADDKINVSASVEIFDEAYRKHINAAGIFLASNIFSTDVQAVAGCTGELLAMARPWKFDIELTPAKLLGKLG